MKYFKKLVGESVYLSPNSMEDAEIYAKWLNDPVVSGYLGMFREMHSIRGEELALEKMATSGHNYAIVALEDDRLVGNICLMGIDHIGRNATIAIYIGETDNRGKGFGADALRLILRFGFKTLNLNNIMLFVHEDNAPGIACYKKVGFKEYGRRRKCEFKNGKYMDLVLMDILSEEFEPEQG